MKSLLNKLRLPGGAGDQHLVFGPYTVTLPRGHLLPVYQRKHPLYDRFLPVLASVLEDGGTVIDVGANCGDTVAAMAARQPRLHYLCVEPDDNFLRYLRRNIAAMQALAPGLQIEAVAAMVGKDITQASLAGANGSKHAVPGADGVRTTTLDAIVDAGRRPPVRLLKSDVDGYDYDVVNSAAALLRRDRPLVYYECQFFDAAQRRGFEQLISTLTEAGYTRWTVFDNFGELMLADTAPAQIVQLMDYVWRQQQRGGKRTVYYWDILAATVADAPQVDRALADYASLA